MNNKSSETWIEWIPNISTTDLDIIAAISQFFNQIPDLYVLFIDPGIEVNRTVITVVGTKTSLRQAVFGLMRVLMNKMDMSSHFGSHPRIGAMDVSPFVLLQNGSIPELLTWVHQLAKEISNEFELPIYLYEDSASSTARRNLADIRRGEYEGLKIKMVDSAWKPDFGTKYNPRMGATIMGVRDYLIAYNVNLNTTDIGVAKKIAQQIRSKGKTDRKHRLSGVKAIGWYLKSSGFCQVSTNIIRTRTTSIFEVFSHCQTLAGEYECQVTGSELIGLLPYHAVAIMMTEESFTTKTLANHLGLGYCGISDLKERIIEHKTYLASKGILYKELLKEFNT